MLHQIVPMLNKLSSYLDMYTGSKSYQVFCARKSTSIYELQQKKTGEQIAALVLYALKKHHVHLTDCRGQGYDNGPNISGCYIGAQGYI